MDGFEHPGGPWPETGGPPASPTATLGGPERYRWLIERIPAVAYVQVDAPPGQVTYLSPRIEQLLGYPVEHLDRPTWISLMHDEDRDRILEAEAHADATKEPFDEEFRMRAADGRTVWLRDQAVYVPPAGDQPGHWLGVFTDVSGEKRLEQELRETVSRFQTLLDQVPAVVYVDPVGREPIASQYVSPYIETLLGITPEQATTQPDWWVRALHPEDREAALRAADEVDRTGEPFRIEYRLVRPDGDVVWVHDEARLVRDDQGRPLCWQGVMFDITDRRRAEDDLRQALELERRAAERLREADELKDTFLTAVSHDLRTPLATILGIAVTLEQEGEVALAAEERRELLRSLAAGARRLAALVDDLLDLDRLRRGVTEPRVREESLDELVAECVDRLELGSDHPLELDLAPLRVPVDRAMVDRIVENLVTNVVRHTPRGTHLWVRLLPDARGGAILVVEDDGPGVPRELGERVFDPFARGPSANPQSPGSGIGLSLVARFAQLHGGRAWVEERPGGGASFRVWLPGRRAAPD